MMAIRSHRLLALAALVVSSCTPRTEVADTLPANRIDPPAVRGTVRVVGSAPVNVQVVLDPAGESPIRVEGPLTAEIRTLSGAEVALRGRVERSGDPLVQRAITPSSYEIISVDGRPVILGEVVAIDGNSARLRTADGSEVVVIGAPPSFRVGQKVWVQGPQAISVQSYGTVRQ